MEQKYCDELARLRLERAIELLDESEDLLKEEKYKSANNRSYYAMEKAIKALLALKGVDAATHSGNLKQFNYHYVFHGDGTFTPDDYQIVAAAEQIRNLSDYDDFYGSSASISFSVSGNRTRHNVMSRSLMIAEEPRQKENRLQ